ncbi:MAG: 2-oxo acid dehydrogenase subunit E2, partial [Bacteroidetes bacterium]|nr:2-oxo acid dehydrogenase subunit E2 [Bacteroidota bacterium]
MAEVIRMPKMSDTMTEGVIVAWNKKVGDTVKSGDILAEVETDKATMELENFVKGTLLHIGIEKGQAVPVDAIIAIVGQAGEDISALIAQSNAKETSAVKVEAPVEETKAVAAPSAAPVAAVASNDDRLKASPLARKIAEEKGISLNGLNGSGENGRIVKRDLDNITPGQNKTAPSFAPSMGESYEDINLSQMRKTIARRLAESKFSAPHFYLTMEIDMDRAVEARKRINATSDVKISMNDFVVKAV